MNQEGFNPESEVWERKTACMAHAKASNDAKFVGYATLACRDHTTWAVARCKVRECCCLPWVFGFEPIEKSVLVEGSGGSTVAVVSLDVGDSVWVFHHLDETSFVPGWQASIGQHSGAQQININRYYLFRFFSHRISFSLKIKWNLKKYIFIYIYIYIYIHTQTNSYYIYKKVYIYIKNDVSV